MQRQGTWASRLKQDLLAARHWRGERPRVALRTLYPHPVYASYRTHPPVRYAPSPVAQLDHWVNPWSSETVVRYYGRSVRSRPKPYVLEVEHWFRLALEGRPTIERCYDWERALANGDLIRARFGGEECRAILTLSPGMTEHFRRFLSEDLWPKLTHVAPAFPSQPEIPRLERGPFTILTVGNRFSDKGIPEALDAYRIVRNRHGEAVRMLLVSTGVPANHALPEGVTVYRRRWMSDSVKTRFYRAADVLLLPNYFDSVMPFIEAAAFGVPSITSRIHHGEAFVRHGVTGFLVEPPIYAISDGFGTRWPSWYEFLADLSRRREAGELGPLVEDAAERLEDMISGRVDHRAMGRPAKALHRERFSPEVRNEEVRRLYASAIAGYA